MQCFLEFALNGYLIIMAAAMVYLLAIFYLLIEMMALGMWLLILPAVVVLSIYLIEWCFCKQD
jgi:hypothetical protein